MNARIFVSRRGWPHFVAKGIFLIVLSCLGSHIRAFFKPVPTLLWFGHGCCGNCMLLEHECYYDFGMDALVTVCFRNTNVIMILAWMLR